MAQLPDRLEAVVARYATRDSRHTRTLWRPNTDHRSCSNSELSMPDRRSHEPLIFPFFVGAGRSGTTLVRAIFDAHPDMAVPDESNFVSVLGRMRARYDGSDGFARTLFLNDLFEQRRFRRWRLSKEDVQLAFDIHPPM